MQGLRWSSFPVDAHQFPKLRLKFKQNLISLAGGMTRLPVTDPKVSSFTPFHAVRSDTHCLLSIDVIDGCTGASLAAGQPLFARVQH